MCVPLEEHSPSPILVSGTADEPADEGEMLCKKPTCLRVRTRGAADIFAADRMAAANTFRTGALCSR